VAEEVRRLNVTLQQAEVREVVRIFGGGVAEVFEAVMIYNGNDGGGSAMYGSVDVGMDFVMSLFSAEAGRTSAFISATPRLIGSMSVMPTVLSEDCEQTKD
jgi:hypothetical protein